MPWTAAGLVGHLVAGGVGVQGSEETAPEGGRVADTQGTSMLCELGDRSLSGLVDPTSHVTLDLPQVGIFSVADFKKFKKPLLP